ncbi:MAG: hypothetical protein ACJAWZ_003721 [Paracoccaceae bacterium]|jgi:hypothetical protein
MAYVLLAQPLEFELEDIVYALCKEFCGVHDLAMLPLNIP